MLRCTNLRATYANQAQPVLHGIDFSAKAGEFIAILGPNGSGKSTFLQALSGVMSGGCMCSGDILLHNMPLVDYGAKARAQRVAVVPQRLDGVPSMSVEHMVLLGRYPYLSWWGSYAAHDYAVVQAVLKEVGASTLRARNVDTLSGGELQRVLLARALAQEAPLLLLDELSAGLDMARMIDIFTVLEQRRKKGACIITVMHDVNLAALYATRLVGIKEGCIVFDGTVENVFTEEYLCSLYESKIHVVRHPEWNVPQACPGKIVI